MFGRATGELIWQGHPQGLREALLDAQDKGKLGDTLSAAVMSASALYSYMHGIAAPYRLLRARYWVEEARRLGSPGGYAKLTHDQCDVIGTTLLRQWLWIRPQPQIALEFFVLGLARADVPPHSRALLLIGKAEAHYLLGEHEQSWDVLDEVITQAHDLAVERDPEKPHEWQAQAHINRQMTRVYRRAMILADKLGKRVTATHCYLSALQCALFGGDPSVTCRIIDQIQNAWNRHFCPRFWHRFLPQ